LEWEVKTSRFLLCGTADAKIKVWNAFADKAFGDIATDPEFPRVVDLACNPNGLNFVAALVSAQRDQGRLLSYNLKTLRIENKLTTDPSMCVNSLSFNHNGAMLVTGCADGLIRIYDMKSCTAITGWQAHRAEVRDVRFSTDETSIYSMGADEKIYQWDIQNIGKVVREYSFESPHAPSGLSSPPSVLSNNAASSGNFSNILSRNSKMAFDPEGSHFIVGSKNNYALLYKIGQPQPTQYLSAGHSAAVVAVDWHPTKNIILTGSRDNTVKICNLTRLPNKV